MLVLSDDVGASASTPMLPLGAGDRFAKVTGPQIGQPLHRKLFVFTRPGWRAYLKQFMTLQEVSGAFGDIGLFLPLLTALAIGRVNGAPQIEFEPHCSSPEFSRQAWHFTSMCRFQSSP